MKRTPVVLIAGLLASTLLVVPSAFGQKKKVPRPTADGTIVLRECSLTLELNTYHPRNVKNTDEAFDIGNCLGLVQGVYANASGNYFCPPDGVGIAHVLDLVVRFVKEHPELEQKDGADIVRWALSDEYPCTDKDSRESDSLKH
jgi:hypothetical protein